MKRATKSFTCCFCYCAAKCDVMHSNLSQYENLLQYTKIGTHREANAEAHTAVWETTGVSGNRSLCVSTALCVRHLRAIDWLTERVNEFAFTTDVNIKGIRTDAGRIFDLPVNLLFQNHSMPSTFFAVVFVYCRITLSLALSVCISCVVCHSPVLPFIGYCVVSSFGSASIEWFSVRLREFSSFFLLCFLNHCRWHYCARFVFSIRRLWDMLGANERTKNISYQSISHRQRQRQSLASHVICIRHWHRLKLFVRLNIMVFNKVLLLPRIMVDTFARALSLARSLTLGAAYWSLYSKWHKSTESIKIICASCVRIYALIRVRSLVCSQFSYYFILLSSFTAFTEYL